MIGWIGFKFDITLAVAPETVGVMIAFAFRFAAAKTEEYPIALEIPLFK